MNIIKCLATHNDYYVNHRSWSPIGIGVHSTDVENQTRLARWVQPSPEDENYDELMHLLGKNAYNNSWNQPGVDKMVHYMIGLLDDGTIATAQMLPLEYRPAGMWKGVNGSGNDKYIQFEIEEGKYTDKEYFERAWHEAVELCAHLCEMYGWTERNIVSHKEAADMGLASFHGDADKYFAQFGKTMDDFREAVGEALKQAKTPAEPDEPTPAPDDSNEWYTLLEIGKFRLQWRKPND